MGKRGFKPVLSDEDIALLADDEREILAGKSDKKNKPLFDYKKLLNPVGRPAKYDESQLYRIAMQYFQACDEHKRLPNKAGLMLYLGISRETYSQYRSEYPDTVKAIDSVIEESWLNRLTENSPAGAIFYLKNAFKEDYREKVEHDVTTQGDKITAGAEEVKSMAAKFDEFFKQQNS